MGMYDYINGEQVKCFPKLYYYDEMVNYSNGSLNGYNTGDTVPFQTYFYNYTPNFIILDIDTFFSDDYSFVAHVIQNGKVVCTLENEIEEKYFKKNQMTIDYFGEPLQIQNLDDVYQYIKHLALYDAGMKVINKPIHNLININTDLAHQLRNLSKDSAVRMQIETEIDKNFKKIHRLNKTCLEEERKLREPLLKYRIDTSEFTDCLKFGQHIQILHDNLAQDKPNLASISLAETNIKKIINTDKTIVDRYLKWNPVDSSELLALITEALFVRGN